MDFGCPFCVFKNFLHIKKPNFPYICTDKAFLLMRSWVFYSKIVTVILLGLSINLPMLITKQYLELQRKAIRREVKAKINAGLKDSELIRLSFEKSAFESQVIRHKVDEFEYKDVMYDIVRQIPTQDSIIYMCWQDDDESIIKKKLNDISKQEWGKNRPKDKQKERQIEFYKNLIIASIDHIHFEILGNCTFGRNNICYTKHYTNLYNKNPFGPPPELYSFHS